ncbi:MAG TPA: ABC transporter ATP-binding protein [bacterium]
MSANAVLCKLQDVHKTYWRGKVAVRALDGIDFEIRQNDYLSIMGPSGSGKSTLVHILGCLDTPTTGDYYLDDKLVSKLSDNELAHIRNRFIGFVFQNFSLLPRLSALENVAMPLIYAGAGRRERLEKAREMLDKVGLADRMAHRPNELSGGECQRVAIARALINNPKIIFADEPTGNLDSSTGSEIMDMFDSLVKEGNTIVLVTHDLQVGNHAQKIVTLRDGKIA